MDGGWLLALYRCTPGTTAMTTTRLIPRWEPTTTLASTLERTIMKPGAGDHGVGSEATLCGRSDSARAEVKMKLVVGDNQPLGACLEDSEEHFLDRMYKRRCDMMALTNYATVTFDWPRYVALHHFCHWRSITVGHSFAYNGAGIILLAFVWHYTMRNLHRTWSTYSHLHSSFWRARSDVVVHRFTIDRVSFLNDLALAMRLLGQHSSSLLQFAVPRLHLSFLASSPIPYELKSLLASLYSCFCANPFLCLLCAPEATQFRFRSYVSLPVGAPRLLCTKQKVQTIALV